MKALGYVAGLIESAARCLKSEAAARWEYAEKRKRPGGRGRYGNRPDAYWRDNKSRSTRPVITFENLKALRREWQSVDRERRLVRAVLKNPRNHTEARLNEARRLARLAS